jgi:hypothetical protein
MMCAAVLYLNPVVNETSIGVTCQRPLGHKGSHSYVHGGSDGSAVLVKWREGEKR